MTTRRILIGGITGGVGREVARLALAAGWHVAGVCRDAQRAEVTHDELGRSEHLQVIVADVSESAGLAAVRAALGEAYCPDALVHLIAPPLDVQPMRRLQWPDYELQLNGMLRPAVLLTQEFLASMAQAGNGRIVAALSAVVFGTPPRGLAAYTTAKYALAGYMRSLAAEYAGRGLGVHCVSPGAMETDLWRQVPALMRDAMRAAAPGGAWMDPKAVARLIYWLASEAPPEITGCNIPMTGGAVP